MKRQKLSWIVQPEALWNIMESGCRTRKTALSPVRALSSMPSSTKTGETGLSAGLAQSPPRPPRILAADDQQHILEAIELLLKPQGYEVDVVRSPEVARESLTSEFYDAVLIDLNYTRDTTSGREGLDLLSEIVALDS